MGRQAEAVANALTLEDRRLLSRAALMTGIGETTDVADKHPEVVARLLKSAEEARQQLGDSLQKRKGAENRNPGKMEPDDARLEW